MKIRLSYIMVVLLAIWTLASCNQEVIQSDSHGYLSVSLDNDLSEDIVSKADVSPSDMAFALEVSDASGKVVASEEDHRTVTAENPIKLKIGNYSMVAKGGEKLNAAFDKPYYEGRTAENFTIKPERTTTVNLTCTLANTLFTVEFPEDFSKFSEYEVAVTNGVGDKLVFSNAPQAGNPLEAGLDAKAYFAVTGILTWELYLKNTDGGEYRATDTYTDVKAKQHYHLKFEMGEEQSGEGGFVIRINLENSWDDSDHDIVLDFYKKNLPKIETNEAFSAVSGEAISVPVGNENEKSLTFNAPEGFRSVLLLHENATLTEKGLPESVEFVGASSTLLSTLASAGFVVSETASTKVSASSAEVKFNMTDFVADLPVGLYQMDFSLVDKRGRCDSFSLVIEVISDVDAEAVAAYTGWASFAKIEGRFFDKLKKDDITFQYKKSSDTEWTTVSKSQLGIDLNTMKFSTLLFSLAPSTEYVFRAVSSEDIETKEVKFTTSAAGTIHNLNFDSWSNDNKFPNASGYKVWDSANSSGATITTTPVSGANAVKGNAARLETLKYMGVLAAGNIFTGSFGDFQISMSGAGATLNWGTSFNSRPIAIRGYYKYNPVKINVAKKPYKDKEGEMDQAQILFFLTDWNSTFTVNTVSQTFVDLDNDSGIIALGVLNPTENNSGYVKFTLPLTYRSNSRIPKYAVIAGASSRYGDYFTGGVGSVLYLDEFELIYDPAELTTDEFNQVFSKVSPF